MIGNGSPEGPLPATAIVTGGTGAIGLEIARVLAGGGRRVALLDRGDVVSRAKSIRGAIGLSCDLLDDVALGEAFAAATRAMGPIGVVVHAAGIAEVAPFLDTDRAAFERVFTVNTTSAFALFQRAARELVATGHAGRFVSIASISGARAGYGRTSYGTSKAALIHLMGQIALELAPYGITANTVAPGPIDTPMSRGAHTAEMRADYVRTIPAGRYGVGADVAHATAFLVSEEARYISGHTLFVDGGYMAAGMGVNIAQSAAAIRRGQRRKDEP